MANMVGVTGARSLMVHFKKQKSIFLILKPTISSKAAPQEIKKRNMRTFATFEQKTKQKQKTILRRGGLSYVFSIFSTKNNNEKQSRVLYVRKRGEKKDRPTTSFLPPPTPILAVLRPNASPLQQQKPPIESTASLYYNIYLVNLREGYIYRAIIYVYIYIYLKYTGVLRINKTVGRKNCNGKRYSKKVAGAMTTWLKSVELYLSSS